MTRTILATAIVALGVPTARAGDTMPSGGVEPGADDRVGRTVRVSRPEDGCPGGVLECGLQPMRRGGAGQGLLLAIERGGAERHRRGPGNVCGRADTPSPEALTKLPTRSMQVKFYASQWVVVPTAKRAAIGASATRATHDQLGGSRATGVAEYTSGASGDVSNTGMPASARRNEASA